ncbi:MAG: dephospho-CoA kinase [Bacteroidales bacterium]|nr:dephospho-CoA kinase [Bacteroidales bacterium]
MLTPPHKPIVGLVGGIGAGKSTAAALFAERGGRVIDADKLGHAVLEEPATRAQIVARWGKEMIKPDGTVNRPAVARIVFDAPAERKALEQMVFPAIQQQAEQAIQMAQQDPAIRFILLDAAVMLEAGWNKICDHTVYVDTPRELRVARLAQRSGWTDAEIAAREAAQLALDRKRSHADATITNTGSRQDLMHQIDELLQTWGLVASQPDTNP